MEKLDRLVTDHLMERLFKPDRLSAILISLSARRAEKAKSLNGRLMALQQQVTNAEDKLARPDARRSNNPFIPKLLSLNDARHCVTTGCAVP